MSGHTCSRAAYQRQIVHRQLVCDGCREANTTEQRGRGVGRSRITHPRPRPAPDMRLYPLIDLLAKVMQS